MEWTISLAHWLGSAVCGQLPEHTYSIGGVALPLCARCTGMYVGALCSLAYFSWRHPRSASLPRSWFAAAPLLFFVLWATDGVNSLLASVPIFPHLYPPENVLRLITGTLMGITIASLIFIVFNSVTWQHPNPEPILATGRELMYLLGIAAVIVLAVQLDWSPVLLPITLASLISVLILNATLMSALVGSFVRHPSTTWRGAGVPILLGSSIAVTFLNGMAVLRLAVGAWAGVPL